MTDQTVQLNSPTDPREQLARAKEIYAAARRAGKSKAAAKQAAYDALPGFKDAAGFGTSLGAPWARAIQSIELNLITAATTPPNGNGDHPTLFPVEEPERPAITNAIEFTLHMFQRWCARQRQPIQPGAVFAFSPHQYADTYKLLMKEDRDAGAFVNLFLDSQVSGDRLRRDGWAFQKLDGSTYELYRVEITAIPQPKPKTINGVLEAIGLTPEQIQRLVALLAQAA